jgi:hypothetical protein
MIPVTFFDIPYLKTLKKIRNDHLLPYRKSHEDRKMGGVQGRH